MRIVAFSDTHTYHNKISVPDGDLVVCVGDFCSTGGSEQLGRFRNWFMKLPHKHKIIVAGNHDRVCERLSTHQLEGELSPIIYLEDSSVEIDGFNFYGTPQQPAFNNWAFNRTSKELDFYYNMIPTTTDILLTHCPPFGVLDYAGANLGSSELANRVRIVQPSLHIFGHIHDGYGIQVGTKTTFINASICNEKYQPINRPVVVDILEDKKVSIVSY